jgi:hypothetical protein
MFDVEIAIGVGDCESQPQIRRPHAVADQIIDEVVADTPPTRPRRTSPQLATTCPNLGCVPSHRPTLPLPDLRQTVPAPTQPGSPTARAESSCRRTVARPPPAVAQRCKRAVRRSSCSRGNARRLFRGVAFVGRSVTVHHTVAGRCLGNGRPDGPQQHWLATLPPVDGRPRDGRRPTPGNFWASLCGVGVCRPGRRLLAEG